MERLCHLVAGVLLSSCLLFGFCSAEAATVNDSQDIEQSLRRDFLEAQRESGNDSPARIRQFWRHVTPCTPRPANSTRRVGQARLGTGRQSAT